MSPRFNVPSFWRLASCPSRRRQACARARLSVVASAVALFLVAGCGGKERSTTPDYRSTSTRAPLEVPPGLKRSGARAVGGATDDEPSTYSAYESQTNADGGSGAAIVLPSYENVRIVRAGNERWLEVQGEPEDLWPRVVDFWVKEQIQLVTENPATGVIETDWLENYAEITSVAQRWFKRVFGSFVTAESYDKFRVRLEPGISAGTTDIFLSHRTVAASAVPGENNKDVISTRWVPSGSNPDIEAEMLRLLMVHLGLSDESATQVAATEGAPLPRRARLERGDDGSRIVVAAGTDVAWRRVGLAIDRIGFTVEDRDRDSGTYYLRSVDITAAQKASEENWLARILSRDKPVEFKSRVVVAADGGASQSVVSVVGDDVEDAKDEQNLEAADRILDLLYEQLK